MARGRPLPHAPGFLPCGLLLLAAVLSLQAAWAAPAAAQDPVGEQQVPLDQEGRLLRIDTELAARLGLFREVANLREVLLFRTVDGFVLEITRREGGRLTRERRPLDQGEVDALRAEVSRRLAERAPTAVMDRSGRTLFLATSTVAGLGFYGWAVPYMFDTDDGQTALALYMLTASASFFGPWLWSSERPVTLGMANAHFWGATRGIVHGIGMHRIIAGEPGSTFCPPEDLTCGDRAFEEHEAWERGRVASALVGSIAESIAAMAWAKDTRATAGDAHLTGVSSDFGGLGAVALGVMIGLEDEESALWGLGLAGAAGGLVGGSALRRARDHSWGDVEVFRAAGLLGAYSGLVLGDVASLEDEQAFAALALGGLAGGLMVGDHLVRNRQLSAGQGLLVDLGTVAGGLLGLGVAVLISDEADGTLHLVLSALGAGLGFGTTLAALPTEGAAGDRGEGPGGGGRLDLRVVPFPGAARDGAGWLPPLGLGLRYSW